MLSGYLTIAIVSFLAAASPGPDFFIVVKNSLSGSRRAGYATSFGVTTALVFHLTYTMVGLGILLDEGSFVYSFVRYVGAAYLFYLGIKELSASFKPKEKIRKGEKHLSNRMAFRQGFMTNLLNPKCALFFLSLFSQFMPPESSVGLKVSYGLINWSIGLLWFLFLSTLITKEVVQKRIGPIQSYIERVMGVVFILIALKIMLLH